MRRIFFMILLATFVLAAVPAFAQHRYLGEGGARVLQCAKFYSSAQAQLLCVRGDELSAGQIERLGLIDRNSQIGQYDGNYGYNGGDGYFYHTDSSGRSMGTREKIVTGGAIGATLGAGIGAIFGRGGTGALLGAGGGALLGAVSASKGNKKAKEQEEALVAQRQAVAQAKAQAVEAASTEQKLLRNRFDALVRLYFRSEDGRIVEAQLMPGETKTILLPRESALIVAEVETNNGKWIRLGENSGMVRLPRNAGWEFFNPSHGS